MGNTTAWSRRRFLGVGGAALGTIAIPSLAGCGGGGQGGSTDGTFALVEAMQKRGHAILGVIDSPPSSMVKDGQPTGYNVEIVQAILRKYEITEFEAFQADFAGMIPGLQASRMDICCAGLLITDERCDSVAMSAASYVLLYAFAVKPGNPEGFESIADIKAAGSILAVESATTQERVAREILEESQIITVAGRQDGADAVRIGRADAYLAPKQSIEQVIEAGGDPLDVTDDVTDMPKIGSAYAMRTNDADFATAFAEDFAELKESGEYAEILEKYGADPTLIDLDDVQLTCGT